MIALTFDDGPNEPYTRQILEVLAEYGAKATFFVIGKWAIRFPEIVKETADAGHEIGNHTFLHPQMSQISQKLAEQEIGACDLVLSQHGINAKVFRAPFGDVPGWMSGEHIQGWHVHGHDWAADSVEEITAPIFAYLDEHKSGIVLLHDGFYREFGADRSKTVEATRRILERYKDQKFVTVSELATP